MSWIQKEISLSPRRRGLSLITREVQEAVPEIRDMHAGILHLFVKHTSASLTLNENADPDVRTDLAAALDALAPEDFPHRHTSEGPDDMPAHVKSSLLGSSLTIPVIEGQLGLGTWQGIYLCEHRNRGGSRQLVLTLQGE